MDSKRFVVGTHEHHIGFGIVVSLHKRYICHVKGRSVKSDRFILRHNGRLNVFSDSGPDSEFLPRGDRRSNLLRLTEMIRRKNKEGD